MPQVFRAGSYWVYFWSNEGEPIEPVHVHVSQGAPVPNATKFWITSTGKCLLANNTSGINRRVLVNIGRIIEARVEEVLAKWDAHFGQRRYYC